MTQTSCCVCVLLHSVCLAPMEVSSSYITKSYNPTLLTKYITFLPTIKQFPCTDNEKSYKKNKNKNKSYLNYIGKP